MKRRELMVGALTLTLAELVGGCQSTPTLKVRLLKNSVPVQLVDRFRKKLQPHPNLELTPVSQFKDLFAILQTWKQQSLVQNQQNTSNLADLVALGDYWLSVAIRQKLIEPLEPSQFSNWSKLPEKWRKLVTRNDEGFLDDRGKVWAAPYRWGTTVIVYRVDKFKALGWFPKDWDTLWREELRDRISLPDNSREAIGLTLKKLGKSYNTQELGKVPKLKEELTRLHRQVKLYSSDSYLQPLILGDTWVAVGWSADVLPLLKNQQEIAAVIPTSGTALWADLWVKPAGAKEDNLVQQWIDFCWQPAIASQLSLLTQGSSPAIVGMKSEDLPEALRNNSLLLPDKKILDRSEFLLPLSNEAIKQYQSLWEEIRQLPSQK